MGRCATAKEILKKDIFSAYGDFFKFESSPFMNGTLALLPL